MAVLEVLLVRAVLEVLFQAVAALARGGGVEGCGVDGGDGGGVGGVLGGGHVLSGGGGGGVLSLSVCLELEIGMREELVV